MIWVIAAPIAGALVASVALGFRLWWPSRSDPSSRVDLGIALVAGALVAVSVLGIQIVADLRLDQIEDARTRQSERQGLQLTVATQPNLTSFRFRGDLSGFIFYDRILREATFTDVDLTDAVLSKSDLSRAIFVSTGDHRPILVRADLNGVHTDEREGVNLEKADLTDAVLTDAVLPDSFFTDADLELADLTGARLPYSYSHAREPREGRPLAGGLHAGRPHGSDAGLRDHPGRHRSLRRRPRRREARRRRPPRRDLHRQDDLQGRDVRLPHALAVQVPAAEVRAGDHVPGEGMRPVDHASAAAELTALLDALVDRPDEREELEREIEERFGAERAVLVVDMGGFSTPSRRAGRFRRCS